MEAPNMNYIDELSGGDEHFRNKFIGILKDEFPKEMESYDTYIREASAEEAAALVHKIKHKFNILAMQEAYTFSVKFEADLKETDFQGHPEFKNHLNTALTFIKTL